MGYRNAYLEKMAFTTITMTGINVSNAIAILEKTIWILTTFCLKNMEGVIQNLICNAFVTSKFRRYT